MAKPHLGTTGSHVCHNPAHKDQRLIYLSDAITKSPKTIKLVSKEDQVVVSVHKKLLCHYSSYYSAALSGKFLEAKKDQFEVDLPGEHLQSFANWLYTGEVEEGTFIQLYIFADQVDIIALRRDIVDVMAKEDDVYRYNDISVLLMNLTQNSPLRKYMLDLYIHHWQPACDVEDPCPLDRDTDPENLLANFVYEVLKGLAAREENKDGNKCSCYNDICQYHEHSSKEEWEASTSTHSASFCLVFH